MEESAFAHFAWPRAPAASPSRSAHTCGGRVGCGGLGWATIVHPALRLYLVWGNLMSKFLSSKTAADSEPLQSTMPPTSAQAPWQYTQASALQPVSSPKPQKLCWISLVDDLSPFGLLFIGGWLYLSSLFVFKHSVLSFWWGFKTDREQLTVLSAWSTFLTGSLHHF